LIIQDISQKVLAAKHSETVNPQLQPLKQRFEELRLMLEKLCGANTTAPASLTLTRDITRSSDGNGDQNAEVNRREPEQMDDYTENQKQDVGNALARMREQRAKFDAAAEIAPEHRNNQEHKTAAKLKELEDELDDALQGSQLKCTEKLADLKRRFKISTITNEGPLDNTPTISTIVRHRN
jgi:hypothetical protein